MKWSAGLAEVVRENEHVASRTWYGVGGRARYFCAPRTIAQLRDLLRSAREQDIPVRVLGGGANVLIRDEGYDGIVVQLDAETFGYSQRIGERMTFGAACDGMEAVRGTARDGLTGLECLAGIPGTIGGLVRMNAGGRFGSISDHLHNVTVLTPGGRIERREREALEFGYRRSNLGGHIVIDATFDLTRDPDPDAPWRRYMEVWDYKKKTQPFGRNTAGCAFKNPPGHSAGKLIDNAGFKGVTCGGACVSNDHANFLLATPGARAGDILTLANRIQDRVRDRFGVDLEFEIDVW